MIRSHRPPESQTTSNSTDGYRSKRGRVSRACNRCHARKVRCDDLQPTCSNCLRAKAVCTTTNDDDFSTRPVRRRKTGVRSPCSRLTADTDSETILASDQALSHLDEPVQPQNALAESTRHGQEQSYAVRSSVSPTELQNVFSGATPRASRAEQMTPASIGSNFHTFTADMGTAVNIDNSNIRRQHMGSSSLQVMTQWLSITFAAYGAAHSFSSQFRHGMRSAVEMQLPMTIEMPNLPNVHEIEAIADIYLRKSGSVLPVLLREEISTLVSLLPAFQDLPNVEAIHRPMLACLYALLSIGYDEKAGIPTDQGLAYLQAAYSMMSHILAMPYLSSVQALLLITITLMGRNKEGAGWSTLGQAIRMAYSLGIHRKHQSNAQDVFETEQIRRTWWIAYCLERLMVFETGRPTMIVDEQVDQELPSFSKGQVATLTALVGLARVQSEISDRLYGGTHATHDPSSYFRTMADIVTKLTNWLRSLPEHIRPDQEPLCCGPSLILFTIYLSFQYHQALITLYRPALLFENKLYQDQLDSVTLEDSTSHKLRAGEAICVNSARATVTLLNNTLQQKCTTRLFTLTQPLLATYVLAIQLIKHPLAWSSASDLKLMASSSKNITDLYIASGQHPDFYVMLRDLQRLSEQSVRYAASNVASRAASPSGALSPNVRVTEPARNLPGSSLPISPRGVEHRHDATASMAMADFELYQTLPFFFEHELQSNDLHIEDAHHLFGLPVVGEDFTLVDDLM